MHELFKEILRPFAPESSSVHQVTAPVRKPRKCDECGVNPADAPRILCVGCQAYREHTGAA